MQPDLTGFVLAAAGTLLTILVFGWLVNFTTGAVADLTYSFASSLSDGLREWWRHEPSQTPARRADTSGPPPGSAPDALDDMLEPAYGPAPTSAVRAIHVRRGGGSFQPFAVGSAC